MQTALGKVLKGAFQAAEAWARQRGYRLSWVPPALLSDSGAELVFDLEFIIAHLMLQKPDLFFVQIGANDGRSNDPLNAFINRFEWRGVLLEPLPEVFAMLQQTYAGNPRLTLLNAALAEQDGTRTIYTIRQDDTTFAKAHQFSSFSRAAVLRQTDWVPDVADRIEEKSISCVSFDTVLREHVRGETVDILATDTEGYDLAVLRMIDFSKMQPSIVCYEHVHMTKAQQNQAAELLLAQGYRLTRDNLDTVAYKPLQRFGFR